MTCTWETADARICGEPAHAFRVKWLPERQVWWYCKRHLRLLSSDAEAKRHGVETYPVTAA